MELKNEAPGRGKTDIVMEVAAKIGMKPVVLKAVSKRFNGFSSTIEVTSEGFLYTRPGKKPLLFHTFIGAYSYDKFIRMVYS